MMNASTPVEDMLSAMTDAVLREVVDWVNALPAPRS